MLLSEFEVHNYRNVLDSTPIMVEEDVTCLVGKNEAGKSALLQALYRLNPAHATPFDLNEQYPRWLLTQDRRRGITDEVEPIRAVFTLEADDQEAVKDLLGPDVLQQPTITVWRQYTGGRLYQVQVDEAKAVANLLSQVDVTHKTRQVLRGAMDFPALRQAIQQQRDELQQNGEEAEQPRELLGELDAVKEAADTLVGDEAASHAVGRLLLKRLPKFFYFTSYHILPGRVDLQKLATDEVTRPGADALQTARALLDLAGTDLDALGNEDYELRTAELEAVSTDLTRQVFEYWKQNQELDVVIDVDKETIETETPSGTSLSAVVRFLEVRVKDRRHGYTNNFGQRSSGFQWFFSFLAGFSEFENSDDRVIVLLDEPAIGLHGRAQADFLRLINERLARAGQVLYTTHSPFMVEPGHLDRVRIVEDQGPDKGAVVSSQVLATDKDSLFPLQAALGYDIAQSLFIGPDNLVIEGTSDFTYLDVLSRYLREQGRIGLDPRWRLTPVGSAANIPTFVALLGRHLDVTVVVDAGTQGMQRLKQMIDQGLLDKHRFITIGDVTGTRYADIEDLFSGGDYLDLFNGAMARKVKVKDLRPGDRIVKRIVELDGGVEFDHGRPADYLLRNRDRLCPGFSATTLDRFERLFERINQTLPST